MTWTINMQGHDDLTGDAKVQFETDLQDRVRKLITELASVEGCVVTAAQVVTNTHGSVDVSAPAPGAEEQSDG